MTRQIGCDSRYTEFRDAERYDCLVSLMSVERYTATAAYASVPNYICTGEARRARYTRSAPFAILSSKACLGGLSCLTFQP